MFRNELTTHNPYPTHQELLALNFSKFETALEEYSKKQHSAQEISLTFYLWDNLNLVVEAYGKISPLLFLKFLKYGLIIIHGVEKYFELFVDFATDLRPILCINTIMYSDELTDVDQGYLLNYLVRLFIEKKIVISFEDTVYLVQEVFPVFPSFFNEYYWDLPILEKLFSEKAYEEFRKYLKSLAETSKV
jgi:hypothetical protein